MAYKEQSQELLMRRTFGSSPDEMTSRHPAVLSCGGIYIPHHGVRDSVLRQLINTNNKEEPVKLITREGPRNVLYEILMKESLN